MARAVGLYREHVRSVFKTELRHLRGDSNPSFAVSGHGEAYTASALRDSLAAAPPHVLLSFSPPYCQAMNPVENAVRHAYYLMNFYMAQAYLTMLAWCDMLLAAVAALNYLPRPQSRNEMLRVKSPHEIATGLKPDLSTHIAAPGQLVVVHHAGAKASACAQTATLCYYVKPSRAGSLVRDVKSWRCYVSYHVRPVRHEIDGIAAQAVAVSHALTSGIMRENTGLLSASAAQVAASVRALQGRSSLWGAPAGPIALLDPVTGLAVRLVHVRLDGTLALEEGSDSGEAALSTGEALGGEPGLAPAPRVKIVPNGFVLDQAPGVNHVPLPPLALASGRARAPRAGSGSLSSWARRLPDDTSISFVPNPKSGKSAARYALYAAAGTLGEYRRLNPASQFVMADLLNDLNRGLARIPAALWDSRLEGTAVTASPPSAALESVHAFALRVAVSIPAEYFADDAVELPLAPSDPLHAQARRLAAHDPSLAAGLRFEDLEDGSPSPPHVGGALVRELLAEGSRLVAVVGLRKDLTSVKAMLRDPGWSKPGGWKEKAWLELNMVVNEKKALTPCTRQDLQAARRLYGNRVEILRILTPACVKHLADGSEGRHKVRLVVTDVVDAAGSTFVGSTFSGTVDDGVVRWLSAITLGRIGLKRRILDVKGAYYEGTVLSPEQGGRVLFAEVPAGWSELGFPEVDANGDKLYYRILKNIPGRRDAGRIWAEHYDRFLRRQGFTQSIVELRLFYKHLPNGKIFLVAVYVDDNWTVCDDDAAWAVFHEAWKLEFDESSNVVDAENDFCGVRYDDMPDGSLQLSCGKLLNELADMISEYQTPLGIDTPMLGESPQRMREIEGDILTDFIPKARSIIGLGLFVVRGARPDGLFAGIALAQHVVTNLTPYVWECVLRWANYLVSTKHFRLVLHPPPFQNGFPAFTANSDSSCINCAAGEGGGVGGIPDAQACATASMGGYTIFFEGSGVVIAECFSPRKLADSSAGSELIMATWAAKAIIGLRMLQRELRMGPTEATPLELDATAVMNGAVMETVTRKQRFNAARLGMLRQWALDKALRLVKVGTGDMRSDILTKPVVPAKHFQRLARLLLTGDAEEEPGGGVATLEVN